MDSDAKLNLDAEHFARRRALGLLATAAIVSALTGLLFVMLWKSYVEGLEPEYFREQGVNWGRDFQRRIRGETNRFLVSAEPFQVELWQENLDKVLYRYFVDEFRANRSLQPKRIACLFKKRGEMFKTAFSIGKDLESPPPFSDFKLDQESGLEVAIVQSDDMVSVVVDGPIDDLGDTIGDSFRFHLVLEFPSFRLVTGRGTTYAVILVIVYLAIIYMLFILVFRLGRRQMQLALSAKEKSIRLKAISSVAEGIAHEVRNPLNAISLNVQYIEKLSQKTGHSPEPGDYQRVYMELGKIRKVIDNFVNFTKTRDLEISKWSMADAFNDCQQDVLSRNRDQIIHFRREDLGDLILSGDRPKVTQILTSLVENALEAMEEAPEKTIDVELTGAPNMVTVAITNHGKTPDSEVMKNMFDPYFSTRSGSLGLGLTLAKTVVESHGGKIRAAAAPGSGLVVTVTLPKEF